MNTTGNKIEEQNNIVTRSEITKYQVTEFQLCIKMTEFLPLIKGDHKGSLLTDSEWE